jgi:indole-3-glycerol phosphate synthase
VNNRDLATFTTDLGLSLRLAPLGSRGGDAGGESGIRTPRTWTRSAAAGVDAVLVGESLMRQPDVRSAAAALTGRAKRGRGAA